MVYLSQPSYAASLPLGTFSTFQSDSYHGRVHTLETLLPATQAYERAALHVSSRFQASPVQGAIARNAHYDSTQFGYTLQANRASSPQYHTSPHHQEYHASVQFLNPHRPTTQFIGKGHDIRHYIHAAFEAVTGKKLPDDIVISVVSEKELHEKHRDFGSAAGPGLQGFSINQPGQRIVIAKENPLDELMLTIGHELGHVMAPTIPDAHDEEAKAFAFEMAWLDAITANDIAGLGASFITPSAPANNGLHNVAFAFVKDMLKSGKQALSLYSELIQRIVEVKNHALL